MDHRGHRGLPRQRRDGKARTGRWAPPAPPAPSSHSPSRPCDVLGPVALPRVAVPRPPVVGRAWHRGEAPRARHVAPQQQRGAPHDAHVPARVPQGVRVPERPHSRHAPRAVARALRVHEGRPVQGVGQPVGRGAAVVLHRRPGPRRQQPGAQVRGAEGRQPPPPQREAEREGHTDAQDEGRDGGGGLAVGGEEEDEALQEGVVRALVAAGVAEVDEDRGAGAEGEAEIRELPGDCNGRGGGGVGVGRKGRMGGRLDKGATVAVACEGG